MDMIKLNAKIQVIGLDCIITEGMIVDKTDHSVDFSIPADDKNFRLFHEGEQVQAQVFGKNKGMLFCGYISKRLSRDVPTYRISNLSEFETIQRREDVRVLCSAALDYSSDKQLLELASEMENAQEVLERIASLMKQAFMIDISAGGVKFSCHENLQEGQQVLFLISICEKMLVIPGTVVHKHLTIDPNHIKYFYGIHFNELDEETKELIIRHVFRIMRMQRRK
jgi:c-di-GMP-binding flagellar brake protein YcgR